MTTRMGLPVRTALFLLWFPMSACAATYYIDYASGRDGNPGTREGPWKHHPWDENARELPAGVKGAHTYVFKRGVDYQGSLIAGDSGAGPEDPVVLTGAEEWGSGEAIVSGGGDVRGVWRQCRAGEFPELPPDDAGKVWYVEWLQDPPPRTLFEVRDGAILRIHQAREPNFDEQIELHGDDPRAHWFEPADVDRTFTLHVESADGFEVGDQIAGMGKWKDVDEDAFNLKKGDTTVVEVGARLLTLRNSTYKRGEFEVGAMLTNGKARTRITKLAGAHDVRYSLRDPGNLPRITPHWAGGTIWIENLHGSNPHPGLLQAVDPAKGELVFYPHAGLTRPPRRHSRYRVENIPSILDAPGEFFYSAKRNILFVRLAGDRDPNEARVVAGSRLFHIRIWNQRNITLLGLHFRFLNEVKLGIGAGHHGEPTFHSEDENAAILLNGNTSHITVRDCSFVELPYGITGYTDERGQASGQAMRHVTVAGNRFRNIGGGAILLEPRSIRWKRASTGRIDHMKILHNHIANSGYRLPKFAYWGQGILVTRDPVVEIAHNTVQRCHGSGILWHGPGFTGGNAERREPLIRGRIHHNAVEDTMLGKQDYGGIEVWYGPGYVYNNISVNAVGYKHADYRFSGGKVKDFYRTSCWGPQIYLDQGYKQAVFNNILVGGKNDVNQPIYNAAGINEAQGFLNMVFNNTIIRCADGLHKGMTYEHNRCYYLNNLMVEMGLHFFNTAVPSKATEFDTLAFGYNVCRGQPTHFGSFEPSWAIPGARSKREHHATLESWRTSLESRQALLAQTGWVTEAPLVAGTDAANPRPLPNTPVVDNARKVFVPWSLYEVVGEWPFHRYRKDPAVLLDEHVFWNEDWKNRRELNKTVRRNNLVGHGLAAEAYGEGILENWTTSALSLDGKGQYGRFDATDDMDMDINSFLIEAVLRSTAHGPVVSKMAGTREGRAGYLLEILSDGKASVTLAAAGSRVVRAVSGGRINDGRWHHLIAEADRTNGQLTLYIDGRQDTRVRLGLPADAGLKNPGVFLLGRHQDAYHRFEIDFLRVSRGSLQDAETDIAELYAWEFDGPFLSDFHGNPPSGKARDVGAVELVESTAR
ncbi:MAG: right-handed parallel beta-helix repeat-containing protein [Kiritimatiellae bacterium]|nr:right-handed parallel beta-helix repeat-containing protein [Kiritimatiellia bacterium]